MRQFVLKSALCLSLSVAALSASTNSTDVRDQELSPASLSASSTALTTPPHPASIPVQYYSEIMAEDGQSIGEYANVGYLKSLAQGNPFIMQEILSHVNANDLFNLYRAGYINPYMWNAVGGKRTFVDYDNVPKKLLIVALAIQTGDSKLFMEDQAPAFTKLGGRDMQGIFDSGDLRGYLNFRSETREHYKHRRTFGGSCNELGQNLRLCPPYAYASTKPRVLNYYNNALTVLGALEWPESLMEINVGQNRLVTLPNFSKVQNIESLFASNNRLRTLEGLGQQTSLKRLSLTKNELTHIPGLQGLVGLEDLDVAYNNLTGSLDLATLRNLKTLMLDCNQLNDVQGLENMADLSYLGLAGNPLRRMPSFKSLRNLKILTLARTGFTTLQDLKGLSFLKTCNLAGNALVTLEDLPWLSALEALYIEDNLLTSLEPLERFTKINALNISGNPLNTLSSLRSPSLLTLYMNAMTGLTSLESLSPSIRRSLTTLTLTQNTFTHLPELSDMGNIESLTLTSAQWENPENRSYLRTLVQNAPDGRGPQVYASTGQNPLDPSRILVRNRYIGTHGEPIH